MTQKERFESLFQQYSQRCSGTEFICLSSTDGFPVASYLNGQVHFELDAMAAASSTLFSVSNAVSKQMLNRPFRVAFVESEAGNVAFVSLTMYHRDYVLTMAANDVMNIGALRTHIRRLADELMSLDT